MASSRRELVKAGVAFGTWTLLSDTSAAQTLAGPIARAPQKTRFTRSAFKSQLNGAFRVYGDGFTTQLTLTAVKDPRTAVQAKTLGSQTCFSLIFQGPWTHPLAQGTYWVTNPGFGKFELFLVPVGLRAENAEFYQYEAAFNQI